MRKQIFLIAGGNGAGKSTFYYHYLQPRGIPFINADLIAKQEHPDNPEKWSYIAARKAEKLRQSSLDKGASFCFETVFSHPSKIDFLAKAKGLGYEIILIYIHLENASLNQARVAQRVSQGGHSVPAEKIISRIPRTMQNIKRALPLTDTTMIFDNSNDTVHFKPIAKLINQSLIINVDRLPEWASEILGDYIDK